MGYTNPRHVAGGDPNRHWISRTRAISADSMSRDSGAIGSIARWRPTTEGHGSRHFCSSASTRYRGAVSGQFAPNLDEVSDGSDASEPAVSDDDLLGSRSPLAVAEIDIDAQASPWGSFVNPARTTLRMHAPGPAAEAEPSVISDESKNLESDAGCDQLAESPPTTDSGEGSERDTTSISGGPDPSSALLEGSVDPLAAEEGLDSTSSSARVLGRLRWSGAAWITAGGLVAALFGLLAIGPQSTDDSGALDDDAAQSRGVSSAAVGLEKSQTSAEKTRLASRSRKRRAAR